MIPQPIKFWGAVLQIGTTGCKEAWGESPDTLCDAEDDQGFDF